MMFIRKTKSGYTADGSQFAHGYFLCLWSKNGTTLPLNQIRACVRYVRMSQCGHWMMARLRLAGKSYSLSGAYGRDGLTLNCDDDHLWEQLIPLPAELYDAWNKGGGWNSCGSEAPAMRQWALANERILRKRISK